MQTLFTENKEFERRLMLVILTFRAVQTICEPSFYKDKRLDPRENTLKI